MKLSEFSFNVTLTCWAVCQPSLIFTVVDWSVAVVHFLSLCRNKRLRLVSGRLSSWEDGKLQVPLEELLGSTLENVRHASGETLQQFTKTSRNRKFSVWRADAKAVHRVDFFSFTLMFLLQ